MRLAIGCVGLVGVLLLVAIVIGVIGVIESRRPAEPTAIDRAQALVPSGVLGGDPELAMMPGAGQVPPGRIVLDVDMLGFTIEPGAPGSEIRLEGNYDRAGYELVESYETAPDGSWTYRLRFKPRGLLNRVIWSSDNGNEMRLIVPPDHPLVLEGRIGKGSSDLELGGLWLVEAVLELGAGMHTIAVSEPLREPLERLELRATVGELTLSDLGNASPRVLVLKKLLGEAEIDLAGAWREDSEMWFDCGLGRCGVELPDPEVASVGIASIAFLVGDSTANVYQRSQPEATLGVPRLMMDLRGTFGESIDVRH